MVIREKRQSEASTSWENSDRKSIVLACPRFGKTRVGLKILQNNPQYEKVLLLFPREEIKAGWQYIIDSTPEIWWHFSTFKSVHKISDNNYSLVIWDEPQEASPNQLIQIGKLTKRIDTLGLTGTLTKKSKEEIFTNTLLDVCYEYTINQAVSEGILADYEVFIHTIPLRGIEKGYFNKYSRLKEKLKEEKKNTGWIDLKLINLLQNSISKKEKTLDLLNVYSDDRILVFCGTTKIADELGIYTYHSKASEKQTLEDFNSGKINKIATINMLQSGITFIPLNKAIVNYTSGDPEQFTQKCCRILGYEFNNPDKNSEIHIVCSDTDFEKVRIKTALNMLNNNKITWL